MSIKFGFSQKDIDINNVTYLSGYFPIRKCNGINDNLTIKTNTFFDEQKQKYYFFVILDVIGVDDVLRQAVIKKISSLLPKKNKFEIFLFATHTHSGPSGMINTEIQLKKGLVDVFGEYDYNFNELLSDQITWACLKGVTNLDYFTYKLIKTPIHGIAADRHDSQNEIDNVLTNLLIETRLNKRVSIVNYPCHLTVLSADNQLLSTDFLFGLYDSAKKDVEMLSFINGSSANISTRFTRNNQTIEEASRLGHRLYDQIKMDSEKNSSLSQIETHFSFINLKVKNLKSLSEVYLKKQIALLELQTEETMKKNEIRLINARVEGFRASLNMKKSLKNLKKIKVPYWLVRFDNQICLMIPGEITSNLTKILREKYNVLIFSLCNDYLFYFVEESLYTVNAYEAQSSFFEIGESEKLIKKIENELKHFTYYNKMI